MVIPIESPWETCSIYACIWMECKLCGRCCPLLTCLVIQLLLKITVKYHATLVVADHHPLNVHDEWSWSFSIFGTSMTSTMITQDGLNISGRGTGWSSSSFCLLYSMHHLLIKISSMTSTAQRDRGTTDMFKFKPATWQPCRPVKFSFSFIILSQLRGSVWAALCCELILKRASDPQQSSDWQEKCRMSSFCVTKADETKLFKKNTQYLHNAIRCNFMNICSWPHNTIFIEQIVFTFEGRCWGIVVLHVCMKYEVWW